MKTAQTQISSWVTFGILHSASDVYCNHRAELCCQERYHQEKEKKYFSNVFCLNVLILYASISFLSVLRCNHIYHKEL